MIIDFENLNVHNPVGAAKNKNDLVINILGDWAPISGRMTNIFIAKDKEYYGEVGTYFSRGDLNIINLETAIDDEIRPLHKLPPRFVDCKEALYSLKSINTHLACLANNHIFDNGPIGLKKTQHYLSELGIRTTGAGFDQESIYKPYCFEKGNSKVGIINIGDGVEANEKYNNHIGAADLESYKVVDQIRALKKNGYFVLLIIHAGVVFMPVPPPFLQKLYRNFIDLGADMIAAHHPHVVQGCEIYRGKPIFYSIGHFGIYRKISRPQEKIGLLLNLNMVDGAISSIKITPFEITRDQLSFLDSKKQEHFVEEFNEISLLLADPEKLEIIWNIYVFKRQPLVFFYNIARDYKYDYQRAKTFSKGQVISYTNRFLLAYYGNNDVVKEDNSLLSLLKKYGVIRKYKFWDRVYLFQKNRFHFIRKSKMRMMNFLRTSKRRFIR